MKRRGVLLLIAANAAVMVVLAFIHPQLMLSPGPVVAAHAGLDRDCFACHVPLRGAESQRCVTCHAPADIGLRTTKGLPLSRPDLKAAFHQELVSQDCTACHVEHEGSRLIGRGRATFSHGLLREATRGQCESCHAVPRDALHGDIRNGCGQCHQTGQWKPATFDHATRFALDRDHRTECATCHVTNDFRRYTCYGCHEHQPARVRQEHLEEGIRDIEDCVRCHRDASGEPEGDGSREGRERD